MPDYDIAKLHSTLESRFTEFHNNRLEMDRVIHRDYKIELPEDVTGGMDAVEYQSADVLKAIFDHVDVLMMNPTRFDLRVTDVTEAAQKAERDILLWMARAWSILDEDRWWDAYVGEGQIRHGVAVPQLCWWPQKQTYEEGEDEDGKRWNSRKEFPFYWKTTNIYGCVWSEYNRTTDAFFYKYQVPVLESGIEKEGKKLTLDNLGSIGWLGPDEVVEYDLRAAMAGKMVDVLVCDYRDPSGKMCPIPGCHHPQRYISVQVGKAGGKTDAMEDVDTYISPFKTNSFDVISGRMSFHETDPDIKYSPMILPQVVEQYYQNYIKTTISTAARKDYGENGLYADLSSLRADSPQPEGGYKQEYDRKSISAGNIPALPHLERIPSANSEHLMVLLQRSEQKQSEYSPNRFVIGTAFTEASNATGTAFLQQAQQAALPYNRLLTQSDGAIKRCFDNIFHAIRFWALSEKDSSTRYYVSTTGSENLMRYSTNGELVYLDAKKLSYDFDILLKTESQTLAEEGARWLQAKDKYFAGVLTPRELAREAGIFDLQAWEEDMYAYDIIEAMMPFELELEKRYLLHSASAKTGIDFGQFMQQAAQPPGGAQAQPDSSGAPNSINVPPNAQMGRSAQQVSLAAGAANGGLSGGNSPVE